LLIVYISNGKTLYIYFYRWIMWTWLAYTLQNNWRDLPGLEISTYRIEWTCIPPWPKTIQHIARQKYDSKNSKF